MVTFPYSHIQSAEEYLLLFWTAASATAALPHPHPKDEQITWFSTRICEFALKLGGWTPPDGHWQMQKSSIWNLIAMWLLIRNSPVPVPMVFCTMVLVHVTVANITKHDILQVKVSLF